ncbi:MarR family winged helix-turn-helix transcriptional regulator [Mycolicibacterium sp. HK-90]|uniref:MarR family winged helix-turn-helix transcriptional regulator n=1 Tax=Mycolicibacterium sp. HK-90 TaxID=3056937 RepID=UPI00265927EF|nr:MarR family transcriptional regulator [Mycolicibacterium sp. HK-90]WKG05061.1 MarR family transcriptional regulator [Mycolicibacterium sp. HK-90]
MQHQHRRRTAGDLPGLDLAEQKSWQSFVEAALRLDAMMNRRLADAHQLSVTDLRVLGALLNSETGSARMGDLAETVDSLPGHLTKRIRRLEERGLVRRAKCPDDGRGVIALITDEGRETTRRAAATYADAVQADLAGALSPAQVSTIEKNCRRIGARSRRPVTGSDDNC